MMVMMMMMTMMKMLMLINIVLNTLLRIVVVVVVVVVVMVVVVVVVAGCSFFLVVVFAVFFVAVVLAAVLCHHCSRRSYLKTMHVKVMMIASLVLRCRPTLFCTQPGPRGDSAAQAGDKYELQVHHRLARGVPAAAELASRAQSASWRALPGT